jgi:hypothetical protein
MHFPFKFKYIICRLKDHVNFFVVRELKKKKKKEGREKHKMLDKDSFN